jgi:colanic acid/amylovoran biosynthesis glycosyltransferase
MNILYIVSQYPSLTETFIAREIAQIISLEHDVTIAILRPTPSSMRAVGIKVEKARFIRAPFSPLSLVSANLYVFRKHQKIYLDCLGEILVASWHKPKYFLYLTYILSVTAWLTRQFEVEPIDFIRSHFLHSEAIATYWLSRFLNKPFSITSHVISIRHDRWLIERVVRHAVFTAAISNHMISHLQNLGSRNIILIRNGIDLEELVYDLNRNSTNSPALILAVGSLFPPKGFDILIQACSEIQKQGIPFHCVILGEGFLRPQLEDLIRKHNLNDKVSMVGAVPFTTVKEYLKKALILVMPSKPSKMGSDGIPTVLIEAMACGVPVVASNYAGIPDLVRDGETGLLCVPGNIMELADCITRLISNRELQEMLRLNARRLIKKDYDLRENVSMLVEQIQHYSP